MLERDDLAPERIVLMTFTEKAAGEIADRIRVALEELHAALAADPPPEKLSWPIGSAFPLVPIHDPVRARRAIAHHLANIDALRSQTIHSFCQSLLRIFPIEAGLDPQFKIIEGFERSLLYGQIYDAWLDEETRVHPTPYIVKEWELLFGHLGYLFMIREVVLALSNRRDLLDENAGGDGEYDFGDFSLVEPQLTEAVLWLKRDATPIKDPAAQAVAGYIRQTPFAGGDLAAWIDYLQPIASHMRNIDLRYCGAAVKQPMVILRSGDKGDSIHERLVSHRAAMALLALTRRFLAFLDEEKRKLGVVDFDDLLLRTLALLDDRDVLDRARAQFDYIFVDEFQDTDRTQARIIGRLARDRNDAFVPGKTIVVGDPKQSIYGFRRADPETYYRMTEELVAAGAERRRLNDQYRSDPPLLDSVNAMFARLFPERPLHDPNVFRPAYHPLHAGRDHVRRELDARVTLLAARHDDKSDRFFAEAVAIAEWIRANRDGGDRDLQRFAILFRRLTQLDDYLDTFDRYGIDYVLPPTRLFLDRPAPVDLLAVLRAVAYPFDRGAQISAARSPYFALTDVEIAQGMMRAEGEPPAAPAWQAFERSMAAFREAARHLTVEQLIGLVITTTGIERVYAAAVEGARSMRHLEHVRAIAFSYDQRLGGSVRQFVDEIARRRGEPEEMEPSLIDESQNAVRIMSVHAAKGLEFETVILPDLAVQSPQNTMTLYTVEEPRSLVMLGRAQTFSANFRQAGDAKLKDISKYRDEAEMQRLFYVAVTRAMTEVVFVVNPDEKKVVGFHRCLVATLDGTPPSWPETGREVRQTALGPVAFETMAVQTTEAQRRPRLHDQALEAELASAAILPVDVAQPDPVAETLTPGEVAARRAGSRSRAAGILLHRVLELWDGRGDPDPLLRQLAVETAADPDAISRVRKRLTTIARSPMLQRIARAETLGREVPVRFIENGTLVERRLDRLLREPAGDTVIDYKSGTPDPHRVARDRDQIERYCQAVSAITGRACGGVLWYVDEERDEIVEVFHL